jgi:hypothetical protein
MAPLPSDAVELEPLSIRTWRRIEDAVLDGAEVPPIEHARVPLFH